VAEKEYCSDPIAAIDVGKETDLANISEKNCDERAKSQDGINFIEHAYESDNVNEDDR
jgi:hypothetical protein